MGQAAARHPEGSVAAHIAEVLDVLELHDEAYNAWLTGVRRGRWRPPRREPTA